MKPEHIDHLFNRLSDIFGDDWSGSDSQKQIWAKSLTLVTNDQIKRGLRWCSVSGKPPTASEFVQMCARPIPDENKPVQAPTEAHSVQSDTVSVSRSCSVECKESKSESYYKLGLQKRWGPLEPPTKKAQ